MERNFSRGVTFTYCATCNSSTVDADLSSRCFMFGQLALWFWQVVSFRLRPAQVMNPQTGKPLEALLYQLAASLLTTPRNRNVAPLTTCRQIISETVIHHCPIRSNSTISNANHNMRSSSESSVASVSCSTASLPSWHTWSWQGPVSELRS